MICPECMLPDPYDGGGDGIGSCDCPSCERCGEPDPAGMHDAMHAEDDAAPDWPDDVAVSR